jgi:hypothetical protein
VFFNHPHGGKRAYAQAQVQSEEDGNAHQVLEPVEVS